jgi:Domain of unknown function (DUF4190)
MTVAPQAGTRTSGRAIASLVLGIALVGLVLGYGAREELRADPSLAGDGLATAGIVLGWIAVAIIALVLLAILFLFAV